MSTTTDEAVHSALADAATRLGLTAAPDEPTDSIGELAGPFVTAQVLGADGTAAIVVGVVDDLSEASEERLSVLCEAVASFGTAPTPGAAAGNGADLLNPFEWPPSAVVFRTGDQVQAVVLSAQDRRAETANNEGDAVASPAAAATQAAHLATNAVAAATGFTKLANVALDVSVELGRTKAALSEVLAYDVGSVVELDRPAGAAVDVRVNGTLLARGEVVLIDDEYAVRITDVFDPQ